MTVEARHMIMNIWIYPTDCTRTQVLQSQQLVALDEGLGWTDGLELENYRGNAFLVYTS